jgi:DNA-binding NarL/FixJ family response regulator
VGGGAEAIEKVLELSPDVIILDISMPVMSGIETARIIREIAPGTKIVIFTIHDTPATARLVSADAFVVKSSAARELTEAISRILES